MAAAHRSTTITSYWSAVGGMPVSNLALTTARRRPKRAAVAGTWNSSLVMTLSTTPEVRSGASRILGTWLVFCTAHSRPASSTRPSTWGTLTPAMAALAPVSGSTVYSWPLADWATIRVFPLAVAWMPLRLNSPLVSAAGPLSASVLNDAPGTPARLTGTKYSWARRESVNQAPRPVTATSLMTVVAGAGGGGDGAANW